MSIAGGKRVDEGRMYGDGAGGPELKRRTASSPGAGADRGTATGHPTTVLTRVITMTLLAADAVRRGIIRTGRSLRPRHLAVGFGLVVAALRR